MAKIRRKVLSNLSTRAYITAKFVKQTRNSEGDIIGYVFDIVLKNNKVTKWFFSSRNDVNYTVGTFYNIIVKLIWNQSKAYIIRCELIDNEPLETINVDDVVSPTSISLHRVSYETLEVQGNEMVVHKFKTDDNTGYIQTSNKELTPSLNVYFGMSTRCLEIEEGCKFEFFEYEDNLDGTTYLEWCKFLTV